MEIAYLRIIDPYVFFDSFTKTEFRKWARLNKYGNPTNEVQYKEDLERVLKEVENYEFLKELV